MQRSGHWGIDRQAAAIVPDDEAQKPIRPLGEKADLGGPCVLVLAGGASAKTTPEHAERRWHHQIWPSAMTGAAVNFDNTLDYTLNYTPGNLNLGGLQNQII